ncbi:Hypothetical predicted protein [Paramuricea clavata]|uniref:Uncharacterized protein n=1 Tax=Paramuricea clavata TaxID=317549 RepID=A0A7D9IYE1_PARCT|nr:Hypothetical predicted protein [Paramuricea clavata]
MSSHHKRKRSHSRDSTHRSSKSKKSSSSTEQSDHAKIDEEMLLQLRAISSTVSDLKSNMEVCNRRISQLEDVFTSENMTHSHSEKQPEPCRDGDTLSILAGNDNPENFEDLAIEPPEQAIEPSEQAIKPPNSAVQLNTSDDICGDRIDPSKQQSVELSNASEGQPGLYDPEAVTTSWSPSQEFKDFLEKNFRRKLSFDHICDILEEQAIPQVDSLVAPTLDPPMLSHVSYQNKKFVQERDKELAVVQRAMLNITGPLCTLHDRLENNLPVSPTELKLLVEQSLCLVGSANSQLSVLRRKKVLASINKSKIDLANQPLPNAQRWLFGDDFPSIASKEAELSRGLAKNLAPTAPKIYNQDPKQPSRSFSQSTKYNTQNNRGQFSRTPQSRFQRPPNYHTTSNSGRF